MRFPLSVFIFLCAITIHGSISLELQQELSQASPNEMVSCIILMQESYPFYTTRSSTAREKISTFRGIAKRSQQNLIKYLSDQKVSVEKYRSYWILNGLFLRAKPAVIREVAERSDVARIYNDAIVTVSPQTVADKTRIRAGIEWGVRKIGADKCWNDGITGGDVIIGVIDTGVDYYHPALKGKWSGHWFVDQSMPQSDLPYDDNKHGTHCTGSICGGDGEGNFEYDIGVAPGAKYAAGKGLNSGGSGSNNTIIPCLEYMGEIKKEANIVAISMSISGPGGSDIYLETFKTLLSLNIVPVVANGNDGVQGVGSVGSPGDNPNIIGVGATDSLDKRGSFSGQGPTTKRAPWNNRSLWIRDDWNYIKPNISAPGVAINSCIPGGGYAEFNGTSMATPHVAGVVALLFQKKPDLTVKEVYDLLINHADEVSSYPSYPNNEIGWGRVNAYKSVSATPAMNRPYISISQQSSGDLAAGKTSEMAITVVNIGAKEAKNTRVECVSLSNFITIGSASFDAGNLREKQKADNNGSPFKIRVHSKTPPGLKGEIGIILKAESRSSMNFLDTVRYSFTIGTVPDPITVFKDDFEYASPDSFSILWKTTGNWGYNSTQSHSATHCGFSGDVVANKSMMESKQGIDLTGYPEAYLFCWYKGKIDLPAASNPAIEVSGDGGSTWNNVGSPGRGSADWRQLRVNVSSHISRNFKIRFLLNVRVINFVRVTDWYVDDVEIAIPCDNVPPAFTNTTIIKSSLNEGPFPIKSTVTDDHGVAGVKLLYRVSGSQWVERNMNGSSNHYSAEIPKQAGTNIKVDYFLEAIDSWRFGSPNTGTFPVGASKSGGFISFYSGCTDISHIGVDAAFSLSPYRTGNGQIAVKMYLPAKMNVSLAVMDTRGRLVTTLVNGKVHRGSHTVLWNRNSNSKAASGLYFLKFIAHATGGTNTQKKVSRTERILLVK